MVWVCGVVWSLMGIPVSSREGKLCDSIIQLGSQIFCIHLEILQIALEKIIRDAQLHCIATQKGSRPPKLDYVKSVAKGPHRMVMMAGWAC